MQVLILADRVRAENENALLARLEVGLADEGARVIFANPSDVREGMASMLCTRSVKYQQTGLALSRQYRVRRFVEAVGDPLEPASDGPREPLLVYVFGEQSASFASELRRQTGACLLFELYAARQVGPLARLCARTHNVPEGAGPVSVITTSEVLAERFRRESPATPVSIAPWGMHAPQDEPAEEAGTPSVCILADGASQQFGALRASLEGLAAVARKLPDLLVFLDSRAADRPAVWSAARDAGILDRLTVVADVEMRREQVLEAGVLMIPERLGEYRSIVLSAMSEGIPIVAQVDPEVEWLHDSRAEIVRAPGSDGIATASPPSSDAWAETITRVISGGAATREKIGAGKAYVRDHHNMATYIKEVLSAYDRAACVRAR